MSGLEKNWPTRILLPALFATASVFPLSRAAAAPPAAGGAEVQEVIVTALRRSTNIQKTPLALSAVSASTLDKSFATQVADLNGTVPSLEVTKTAGMETLVTIRGVGDATPENGPVTTPGVSLFIDGVYIANTISLDQTLFDIDHIEVLRGPQGALYGQSSIGGAISLVTKQPVLHEFSGSGDLSAGTYSLYRGRAEVNIPLGDTLAFRGSIQKFDHAGFTKDVAAPGVRLDDAHDAGAKVALLWKPTDTLSATLTAQLYDAVQNGAAQKNILDPAQGARNVTQDFVPHFELHSQLYHLNVDYNTPWFTVHSVTAYQGFSSPEKENSSRLSYAILGSYDDLIQNTKLENYSEELDLLSLPGSKLDWIVGAFAQNQHTHQYVVEFEGSNANPNLSIPSNIETNPPSNLGYGNDSTVQRFSYSAFAQGTYPILQTLRLTVGARYNYDTYSQDALNFSAYSINRVTHAFTDSVPTGRIQLDYDVTSKNLVYASIARGYKPGGVNGIYGQAVISPTFKPETNLAYEVGSKNQFLDRTLSLNLAAFFYDYRNMQYIEDDPVPYDGGIENIPSVHAYGLEAEGAYNSSDGRLHMTSSLAYEKAAVQGNYRTIDSTVQNAIESTYAGCQNYGAYNNRDCWSKVEAGAKNIRGNTPPAMPVWSGSFTASYTFDVPFGKLTPGMKYVYRGSEWARIFNEASLDKVKAYQTVDLNLTYAPTTTRVTVSLVATNVFDAAGVNSQYTDPYGTFQTSRQYIPPRQVIGTIAYAF